MSIRQVDKRVEHIRPRAYAHSRHGSAQSSTSSVPGNPYANGYVPSGPTGAARGESPSKRRRLSLSTRLLGEHAARVFRPRTILYVAATIVGVYLFLEPNRILNPPKLSAHVPVPSGTKDLRIKAQKKVKDTLDRRKGIFNTLEDIKRDIGEPDFALLSGKQPHEITCDVPLVGETTEREEIGRLALIGVFTTPEAYSRRELIRELVVPNFPSDIITFKFVMGALPKQMKADKKSQMQQDLVDEMLDHGDIIFVAMEDHIQLGKTHQYLDYLATEYASLEGVDRRRGRPRFALKADHDTVLVAPNIISSLKDVDCRDNVYWGSSIPQVGGSRDQAHLESKVYGLSWPLVSWIGSATMPGFHTNHTEDIQTAQWLTNLDPATDPIRSIDLGRAMVSWKDSDVSIETAAIYGVGDDGHYREQYERIRKVWEDAGRAFDAENGVEAARLIARGRESSPYG